MTILKSNFRIGDRIAASFASTGPRLISTPVLGASEVAVQGAATAREQAAIARTAANDARAYAEAANDAQEAVAPLAGAATDAAQASATSAAAAAAAAASVADAAVAADASARKAAAAAAQATAVERNAVDAATSAVGNAATAEAAALAASGHKDYVELLHDAATAQANRADARATDATNAQHASEAAQAAGEAARNASESARAASQTAQAASEAARDASRAAQVASEAARVDLHIARDAAQASAVESAKSALSLAVARDAALAAKTAAETARDVSSAQAGVATTKASEAATSKTGADAAKTAAETAKTAAETARGTATTKAGEAAASATAADTSKTAAAGSAAAAATSATAAAGSATAASTSATNAAGSATAANTSKTVAAGSATAAATSATAASTKASEAAASAAAAAVSEATTTANIAQGIASAAESAASAKSAATSATTATTQATAAASSATAAGTSATNAAGSASSANTSKTAAAGSATAAATSAATASTKASEAAVSAAAAATSEATTTANIAQGIASASESVASAKSAAASAATATTKASEAAASATVAFSSKNAAELSASTAATEAGDAAASATDAATSASAAAGSATAAATSKTAANTAKTAAETAKTAAETARTTATTKAGEAAASAVSAAASEAAAGVKAGDAAASASAAATSAATASARAVEAAGSASAAATSATSAAASATAAAGSATAAATSKTGADTAKTAAETAKTAAETARATATTKAGEAATSATAADASKTAAAGSATAAAASAATATAKATAASDSATAAHASATSAAGSATAANTSKTAAEGSATAAAGSAATAGAHAATASTAAADAGAARDAAAASATTAAGARDTALTHAQAAEAAADRAQSYGGDSQQLIERDASGGYAGLTGFKLNMKNALGTIISFLTNANTAERTYTLPNKSGTVALTSDITGVNSGTNTGDETQATIKTKLGKATAAAAGYLDSVDWARFEAKQVALGYTPIDAAKIGVANGIVPLGADAKIAPVFLPSYVDDVVEFTSLAAFPATGESGKLYVSLDTNKVYRWSGTVYAEISASPGSTDAVPEGASNLYFTESRARGTSLTGLTFVNNAILVAGDTIIAALGKLQAQVSSRAMKGANSDINSLSALTTAITIGQGGTGAKTTAEARANLNLGNVENKSSATILAEFSAAYGIGAAAPPNITDLDSFLTKAGVYVVTESTAGAKPFSYGTVLVTSMATGAANGTWAFQTFYGTNNRVYRRSSINLNPWNDWVELGHTGSNITGNAATATNAANADKLGGMLPSSGSVGDSVVSRNSSGNSAFNLITLSHAQAARNADTVFYSGTDNSLYKNTAAGFKTSLALNNVENKSAATILGGMTTADVHAATYTTGISMSRSFEKTFGTNFDDTADKAVNLEFDNVSFNGAIEVEISASYSQANANGVIVKRFAVGVNPGGAIWNNESRVIEVIGKTADHFAIGDFAWDAANSKYIIPISHRTNTRNPIYVRVRGIVSDGAAVKAAVVLGAIYALPALPKNTASFDGSITGSAATLATPRTINGVPFNGSANITINAVDSTAREAAIAAGSAAQYWRGDKTWQALNSAAVGLGNVENKSAATINGEMTNADVTKALGYTPFNAAGGVLTGDLTATLDKRLRNISVLPSGYVEPSPVNFRFDQDALRFINRRPGMTMTLNGFTAGEVDNLFSVYTGYVNLASKPEGCSIQVEGFLFSSTANAHFYPFVFMHSANGSIRVVMEVKTDHATITDWQTMHDGPIGSYVVATNGGLGLPGPGSIIGARWTFYGHGANNVYVRSLGVISRNGPAYAWTVMKGGDTMFGNLDFAAGYTVKINGSNVWHAGNDGAGSGLDADLLDGYQLDYAPTPATVVRRDGSGFIYAVQLSMSADQVERTGDTVFYSSSNSYIYKNTAAGFKTSLALNNVENKSSATIRGELTSANVTTALGLTPPKRAPGFGGGEFSVASLLSSGSTRAITDPSTGLGYAGGMRVRFGFTNDVSGNYSDILDLSTYTDSSGGGVNALYLNKQSQAMYHKWAAAGGTAWTTKTIAYTDSNVTGNTTGNAGSSDKVNATGGNETTIAQGYAHAGGHLYINYRGANSIINVTRFCDGMGAGGLSAVLGKNIDASGNVTGTAANVTGIVAIANGGTGAATAAAARANLALGNVENKSAATINGEMTSANVTTALGFTPADAAKIGAANGIVPLGADAKIAPIFLPSYVDDVVEFANLAAFPATGESGKLYIAINAGTSANPTRQYRWSGTVYAEINASPGSTDAVPEGASNLYFTAARVLGVVAAGLSTATNAAITAADTILAALGKLQAQVTARAMKGANSDITALSGLTTALTVPQGGTGVKTLTGLAYGNGAGAFSVATAAQVATVLGTQGIAGNAASASAAPWGGITGKPTTAAGYGITDVAAAVPNTIIENQDWNTITKPGVYQVVSGNGANKPPLYPWGMLIVTNVNGVITQQYFSHQQEQGSRVYYGDWWSWRCVLDSQNHKAYRATTLVDANFSDFKRGLLANNVDFNWTNIPGMYRYNGGGSSGPSTWAYGNLLIVQGTDSDTCGQLYIDHASGGIATRGLITPTGAASPWRFSVGSDGWNATGTWGINITGMSGNTSSVSGALNTTNRWNAEQAFNTNRRGAGVTTGGGVAGGMFVTNGGYGNGPACMTFLLDGEWGVNFGLDSDYYLRIGGWNCGNMFGFGTQNGDFSAAGNISAFSDERLKQNWRALGDDFVELMAGVKAGIYDRKDTGLSQAGVSAQDVRAILPHAVTEGSDEMRTLTLAYGNFAGVGVVKLAQRAVAHEARIAALEGEVAELKALVQALLNKE